MHEISTYGLFDLKFFFLHHHNLYLLLSDSVFQVNGVPGLTKAILLSLYVLLSRL